MGFVGVLILPKVPERRREMLTARERNQRIAKLEKKHRKSVCQKAAQVKAFLGERLESQEKAFEQARKMDHIWA